MEQIIFHIDVNSAFLSWTAVRMLREGDSTDIREIPSIIGGDRESRHGIVLAKSIPAKIYKIQTGEPVMQALKKCPNLLVLPPDHKYYHEQSRKMMDVLFRFSPEIEQVSVDECYLDFTSIAYRYSSPVDAARLMKDTIHQELGFTVNVGISSNKVLAKMASDFHKPDKIHTLFPEEIENKMWKLPVRELFMVGKSCAAVLLNLGITTIGELAATPPELLEAHLKSHGRLIWEFANGIDLSRVEASESVAKGVGNSTTLSEDVVEVEEAKRVLLTLAESVATRLRKAELKASMITVEIKYSDFTRVTHQGTLREATNLTAAIYEATCCLFDELWNHSPIRLLGIRTSKLISEDTPVQLSLFQCATENESRTEVGKIKMAENAVDTIRKRFGDTSILRASLLKNNTIIEEKKHE